MSYYYFHTYFRVEGKEIKKKGENDKCDKKEMEKMMKVKDISFLFFFLKKRRLGKPPLNDT